MKQIFCVVIILAALPGCAASGIRQMTPINYGAQPLGGVSFGTYGPYSFSDETGRNFRMQDIGAFNEIE
jgi:hypothetical protein